MIEDHSDVGFAPVVGKSVKGVVIDYDPAQKMFILNTKVKQSPKYHPSNATKCTNV